MSYSDLIFEHLRAIRAAQDITIERLDNLTERVAAVEHHTAQFLVDLAALNVRFDQQDTRLSRIERRLEINDEPD